MSGNKKSIWVRPIDRRILLWPVIGLLSALILLEVSPRLMGLAEWCTHRTMTYQSQTLSLPPGWVLDRDAKPLTLNKPTYFTSFDSSLSVHMQTPVSGQALAELGTRFSEIQSRAKERKVTLKNTALSSLSCAGSGNSAIVMFHCATRDYGFVFQYTGHPADVSDAELLMLNLMTAHPVETPVTSNK